MIHFCNILIGVSVVIFLYNIWLYRKNAEFEMRDEMGLSINFNLGYALAIIPLFISLLLYPNLKWWWSFIALSTIFYAPLLLKPIIHKLLKILKLVDKQNT
ncbi:MAG: hypothetical protein KAI43_07685 [Candidatus Aureabacteria bacterium]|nr:hypothetical protein [Candidatus Auribacterota bacterium]